tara:strand:- start:1194 stop:1352 length:159 start_codon:yes stop_codon:yes gene_type:complete
MNNLVKIREKIKKQERLHQAKLLATKNGEVSPYRRSVYEKRLNEAKKQISSN